MATLRASKFRGRRLPLLVGLCQEGIGITKRGGTARVFPARAGCTSLIGSMREGIKVKGNILSAGLRWGAEL